MIFQHHFRVRVPLIKVASFHSNTKSMAAISPPPIIVQVHRAPAVVAEAASMDFTLWFGPLPLRWKAQFEQVSPNGFCDTQTQGPFHTWHHQHHFIEIDPETTEVYDRIEATYHKNPFWRLVGVVMWLNLPILFAYRGWRTRKLLEA